MTSPSVLFFIFIMKQKLTHWGCLMPNGIRARCMLFLGVGIWQPEQVPSSGPLFTKKMLPYQYRDSHYKPETVVRPSEVYHGDPYTRKTASSQWIEALENANQCLPWSLLVSFLGIVTWRWLLRTPTIPHSHVIFVNTVKLCTLSVNQNKAFTSIWLILEAWLTLPHCRC